jgi:hypothetical protein
MFRFPRFQFRFRNTALEETTYHVKKEKRTDLLRLTYCTVGIHVYVQNTHREGGGGGELTRENFRGAILHKAGRNTNMTDCKDDI